MKLSTQDTWIVKAAAVILRNAENELHHGVRGVSTWDTRHAAASCEFAASQIEYALRRIEECKDAA